MFLTETDEAIDDIKEDDDLVFANLDLVQSQYRSQEQDYVNDHWGKCGRYLTIFRTDNSFSLDIKELKILHVLGIKMFDN